jgi:hypothetical protein
MPITAVRKLLLPACMLLLTCGKAAEEVDPEPTVHIALYPSFSMPLPDQFQLKEIGLRRVDCAFQDESLEHSIEILRDDELFVFNVSENEISESVDCLYGAWSSRMPLKSSSSQSTAKQELNKVFEKFC